MPELPDVVAYVDALRERIVGRRLERVRIARPFVLRTAEPTPTEGRNVREVRRVGKRIAIGLDGDLWLVLHLMIAGRLHWRPPRAALAGRTNLAAFDFPNGSLVLTEAGTKRRASLSIVRGKQTVDDMEAGGVDVLTSDFDAFRAALLAENRTLKRALTDPRICKRRRQCVFRRNSPCGAIVSDALTHKLTPAELERLYNVARETLQIWVERHKTAAHGEFPEMVTAFHEDMAVHGRYGKPCPRCGDPIQRIRYADNETNYCARCQTGGKLLADRALSRLLGSDWPRTLAELETLKHR